MRLERVWDVFYSVQLNWLKLVHFLCEFELCLVNNQWNVSYSKEFTLKILAQLGLFCITCPFKREKDLCLKLEINSSLYSNFLFTRTEVIKVQEEGNSNQIKQNINSKTGLKIVFYRNQKILYSGLMKCLRLVVVEMEREKKLF